MNRRGQIEGLKETVIMVLEVAVALMLLALIIWAVMLFFSHEPTPAERDLERVYAEIESLAPKGASVDAKLSILTEGADYIMDLLPADNDEPKCGKKACLCIHLADRTRVCKELPRAMQDASKGKDCSSALCILQASAVGSQRAGAGIPLCVTNNELRIGPLCG